MYLSEIKTIWIVNLEKLICQLASNSFNYEATMNVLILLLSCIVYVLMLTTFAYISVLLITQRGDAAEEEQVLLAVHDPPGPPAPCQPPRRAGGVRGGQPHGDGGGGRVRRGRVHPGHDRGQGISQVARPGTRAFVWTVLLLTGSRS